MNQELFGYVAALLTTTSFLPQAVITIRSRDTHSLSLGMYNLFTAGVVFWLLYGIHNQDIAIITANTLTLLLASLILILYQGDIDRVLVIKLYNTLRAKRKT